MGIAAGAEVVQQVVQEIGQANSMPLTKKKMIELTEVQLSQMTTSLVLFDSIARRPPQASENSIVRKFFVVVQGKKYSENGRMMALLSPLGL